MTNSAENSFKEENLNELDEIQLVDLAEKLSDYEEEELNSLLEKLDDEELARVLEEAEPKIQKNIISCVSDSRMIEIFKHMSKDDIVDVLGVLNTGRRKQLVNTMKKGEKEIIKELLGYKEDSAGGIMTTEYIALYGDLSIEEAIKKIKEIVPKTEYIQTIYVMDKNKGIVGTIDLRDVLTAENDTKLKDIMEDTFIYVEPELDQEEVAKIVSKYDLNAVPVLNSKKRMLGIIMVDDIVDVIEEEHTEDILKMGGVAKEETLDSTLLESIKMRLPWLLVNLLTAFLAAFTVKVFENTIAQVVALSATMSIVTGMGGNAGTQTVSIIIRNLAMGKVKFKEVGHLIIKEVTLGLINGAIIGLVTRSYSCIDLSKCVLRINNIFSNDWKLNGFRLFWTSNTASITKTKNRSRSFIINIFNNSNRCIRIFPIFRTSKFVFIKIIIEKF